MRTAARPTLAGADVAAARPTLAGADVAVGRHVAVLARGSARLHLRRDTAASGRLLALVRKARANGLEVGGGRRWRRSNNWSRWKMKNDVHDVSVGVELRLIYDVDDYQ